MRKVACCTLILTCICIAAAVQAAPGDLKGVKLDPKDMAALSISPTRMYTRSLANAPAGCGTVSPEAKVAAMTAGSTKIKVAVDSAKADADEPSVVRFDFSGKGKFDDTPTLPLKKKPSRGSYRIYEFGPAAIGGAKPAMISGSYVERGKTYRYISMSVTAAVQGSCTFGRKVCGVRVVDGNGNLQYGDGTKMTMKGGRVTNGSRTGRIGADVILIDADNETFKKPTTRALCGQLAEVGGKWYRVSVDADGSEISAASANIATGKLVIPHDDWSVTLVGTKNVLSLRGGKDPVAVPPDTYVAAGYEERAKASGAPRPARLLCGQLVMYGRAKGKVFEIEPGKTMNLAIGTPLKVKATVAKKSGQVMFSSNVQDAGGTKVDSVLTSRGSRVPPPGIAVVDEQGKKVYDARLKYG